MPRAEPPDSELPPLPEGEAREIERLAVEARRRLAESKESGLALDMTRGKPSPEQLDLAAGILECVGPDDYRAADGTDCRNYGGLEGLPEVRKLFGAYLEVTPEQVLVGGNASLALMHDVLVQALLKGVPGSDQPWARGPVKFLCPCPGYDRHFFILERFGVEMIPVAMGSDGPDMEAVQRHARDDQAVRGIFCVPKYSNPTGVTYSDEVVRALARMRTRAADFRIFWDNAYAVHHLGEQQARLLPMLRECEAAGHADRVFLFASTSKISLAGGGLAVMAGSSGNVAFLRKYRSIQTIGPDKLNQLRHARFFGDLAGLEAHMRLHGAILKPKFEAVHSVLDSELGELGVASWSRPLGGYFISLDTQTGCARRVVSIAGEAGVALTPAGATFPHRRDPRDRNLRIAPSFPGVEELRSATRVLADAILVATAERLQGGG